MGSFNTTCFASQQTIASGDACYVLPIYQSSTYRPATMRIYDEEIVEYGVAHSTCYPDAFWVPAGGFIECHYDDYGKVTVKDTKANRTNLLALIIRLYEEAGAVEQGENEYHDHPFKLKEFVKSNAPYLSEWLMIEDEDERAGFHMEASVLFEEQMKIWEYLWAAVDEYRLFIKRQFSSNITAFQFAVIHKVTYDVLVKNIENQSRTLESYFQAGFEKEVADGIRFVAGCGTEGIRRTLSRLYLTKCFKGILQHTGEFDGNSTKYEDFVLQTVSESFLNDMTVAPKIIFDSMRPLLEMRYILAGLEQYNLKITPMVYASQDYNNLVGKAYAKFVANVSKEVTKDRKKMDKD